MTKIYENDQEYRCIQITWLCNWDCDYCCTNTHVRHQTQPIQSNQYDKILQDFLDVPMDGQVSLSGGEPGLATSELIYGIMKIVESRRLKLDINTNGQFIKNYWYEPKFKKYKKFVTNIRLHLAPEFPTLIDTVLKADSPRRREVIKWILEPKVEPCILIHNENYKEIKPFLEAWVQCFLSINRLFSKLNANSNLQNQLGKVIPDLTGVPVEKGNDAAMHPVNNLFLSPMKRIEIIREFNKETAMGIKYWGFFMNETTQYEMSPDKSLRYDTNYVRN